MDSSTDNSKANVKRLASTFFEKEWSDMCVASGDKRKKDKGQRVKTSGSSGCLSVKSAQSIETPLLLKSKQVKTSGSSGCLSVKSAQSIETPLLLKGKQVKTSGSSGCLSVKSAQSIETPLLLKGKQSTTTQGECLSVHSAQSIEAPLLFKDKQVKTSCSGCVSVKSAQSIEPPLLFKGKQQEKYGTPKFWAGHVISSMDANRLNVPCTLAAVCPVRTDHQAPDYKRTELKASTASENMTDTPVNSEDTMSSVTEEKHFIQLHPDTTFTSDSSSTKTGSRDSHYDDTSDDTEDEEVICDICGTAAAVKTCLTCNISYCEKDVRHHYTVKALQRHTLRDVCHSVERKRCVHYKKSLDFFCRTDQMQICSRCVRGNHRGHDIVAKMEHAVQNPGLAETVPPPGKIKFLSVRPNSVVLSWGHPEGLEGSVSFRVKWSSTTKTKGCLVIKDFHKIEINNLQLGQKYFFGVATNDKDGNLSEWVKESVITAVPAPRHLTKEHSEATAFSLRWTKGENMGATPHQFLITVTGPEKEPLAILTEDCYKAFSDLEPDTEYVISVSTTLNDLCSEPVSITINTEPCLREVLSKIGLEDQYDNKLVLSSVLEINQSDTSEIKLKSATSLPETFLKKLTMMNANARSVRCSLNTDKGNAINPLDLITGLFLCSDSFLQQYIVLKMALCQFAVPLLLPNHETRTIMLMLWSMRDIVRAFTPSSLAFKKSSCEERIVLSDIPLVSFVRLGRTILSKSQVLNKLLSNSQQCNDTFYHRNMVCGDVPRRISDGLVEISWYLPSGNRNTDRFTEPLAVANLRGDIRAFDKQFSFLCQTSAAVYIFCDESEADYFKKMEGMNVTAKIILISSVQGKNYTLQMMTTKPNLKKTNVSQKKKDETELTKALHESVSKMVENCPKKVSAANLADSARYCEIEVDEDSDECQSARKNVGKITQHIANTSEFKEEHLASQGHIWKAVSWLETECWRLRKAGNQNTEEYRKSLKTKETELRRTQRRLETTAEMSGFLHGLVTSEVQRYYFLKWLEMDLDNLSRNQLSVLQNQYIELSQKNPQDPEKIAEIDKQISDCSLRLDHFLRECGQLYQSASYLPEYSSQRKTMEQLPALCAQMLLDGFPLELVDGDAANISMKWIMEVLTEVHYIMQSNSKVKVLTIIGAENSGKSTLLNTMFGARFAVSKGTCTRGAFIQLINVNKEAREELGCDCIMIIDTEGLKLHQMVQDDHSHERDKEVASLAVALSDATIISVSRDDSSEKDFLEMVLHAFTRLMDVKRKPLCHFVCSKMSEDPAAKRRNSEDLQEMLNVIIREDIKMKKANITKISDVMELTPYSCSWHIPPVWHGTPPMASFSVNYSETANSLRKQLLQGLKKHQARGDLMNFIGRMESFWNSL